MAAKQTNSAPLFLAHVTTAGERWDQLAWQYYGDPTLYGPIVMANPSIPIEPEFEAGLTIGIPLLTTPAPGSRLQADLPPWQRIS